MTKKEEILTVTEDLSGLFDEKTEQTHVKVEKANRSKERDTDRFTVVKALETVTRQMEISGNRPRTISDYNAYVNHFTSTIKIKYIDQLNADHLYEWLASMDVSK
ncbi:hypothetical protein [Bacillus salipaludis]|uniref:Uncharacterized protein n=1 Tax=Bacillus salipaludis TaxID=2547811 RepID=A0ABW8RCR8_9BACI